MNLLLNAENRVQKMSANWAGMPAFFSMQLTVGTQLVAGCYAYGMAPTPTSFPLHLKQPLTP